MKQISSIDIKKLIHHINPYENFNTALYQEGLQGWGSDHPAFEEIISQIQPKIILEVGTWKGASAIHMARLCESLGLDETIIVCVDTWLGSIEFWTDHNDSDRYLSLALKNGYPTVYYQFLANVVFNKMESRIIPFPVTSALAAKFFQNYQVKFDLIYIDASHEYEDIMYDLNLFWGLVNQSGILFGDDFDSHWPSVMRAVTEFCISNAQQYELKGNKWLIKK
jgi:hypothetical protein